MGACSCTQIVVVFLQVILVRSASERDALNIILTGLDVSGVILTVAEVKGLEFSDVLCWNFFCSCTACPESCWLNLHAELEAFVERTYCSSGERTPLPDEGEKMLATIGTWRAEASRRPKQPTTPGQVDQRRQQQDSLWAQELKELYVLGTRPRKRLLFFEERGTLAVACLRDYCARALQTGLDVMGGSDHDGAALRSAKGAGGSGPKLPVVRFLDSDGEAEKCVLVREFRRPSTPEEYIRRGLDFVEAKLLVPAIQVFEASGNRLFSLLGAALLAAERERRRTRSGGEVGRPGAAAAWFRLAQTLQQAGDQEGNRAQQEWQLFSTFLGGSGAGDVLGKEFSVGEDSVAWAQKLYLRAALLFECAGDADSARMAYTAAGGDDPSASAVPDMISSPKIQDTGEEGSSTSARRSGDEKNVSQSERSSGSGEVSSTSEQATDVDKNSNINDERTQLENVLRGLLLANPDWAAQRFCDEVAASFPSVGKSVVKNLVKRLRTAAERAAAASRTKAERMKEEEARKEEAARGKADKKDRARLEERFRIWPCIRDKSCIGEDIGRMDNVIKRASKNDCGDFPISRTTVNEEWNSKFALGLIVKGPLRDGAEDLRKILDLAAVSWGTASNDKSFCNMLEELHIFYDPSTPIKDERKKLSLDFETPPLSGFRFPNLQIFCVCGQELEDIKISNPDVMPQLTWFALRELHIHSACDWCFPRLEVCRFYKVVPVGLGTVSGLALSLCKSGSNLKELWSYQLFRVAQLRAIVFPELKALTLFRCDNLELLHLFAPKLELLDISGCYNLTELKFIEDSVELQEESGRRGWLVALQFFESGC